jgi:hypothetical protein
VGENPRSDGVGQAQVAAVAWFEGGAILGRLGVELGGNPPK